MSEWTETDEAEFKRLNEKKQARHSALRQSIRDLMNMLTPKDRAELASEFLLTSPTVDDYRRIQDQLDTRWNTIRRSFNWEK